VGDSIYVTLGHLDDSSLVFQSLHSRADDLKAN